MHAARLPLLLTTLFISAGVAQAGELEQQMLRCSVLGDPSARLGCFDTLTKAATAETVSGNPTPDATVAADPAKRAAAAAAAAEPAKPIPAVASNTPAPPETPISRLEQLWELSDASRRGTFAVRPHRENYLLVANYSTSSNDAPYRDFTPSGLKTKRVELTYQLSLKMKAAEKVAGLPVDIWLGYTQQSFWQAYNRSQSSPFRETNYQPEIMAVVPINKSFGPMNLRFVNFGLIHQSNGQTSTLSRSWNRMYTEVGVDNGNFALTARLWRRLDNAKSNNDNPDITDYLARGDVRASYRKDGYEYSIMARRNMSTDHGAIQAAIAYPLATNLKGYVQVFSGYGQSLIDYNYSQRSVGAGFTVDF
ncbi:phospholipase A [Massilia violaceinigra]|uniref:Phospholipase A1 n=1 Tax=Massilia violaceinigra TaxID=2045208 RepID=A0ABY4ADX5_9BURK|nr:phospholipase A [Massilia violaceinigra]UOD31874.1 phospholipase A [Massilia violaceinigra]